MSNIPKFTKEKDIYQAWEDAGIYAYDVNSDAEEFSIDTPPPTISGLLHMGHMFSYSHIDFIARFKRMRGMNVFFPIGFDNNGLPTERLIEKITGIKPNVDNKDEFIEKCFEIIKDQELQFQELFKVMGYSFDWKLKYDTIGSQAYKIAQESFLDLVESQNVYRHMQPVFWDTVDQTALAQAEIEDKEASSLMHNVEFAIDQDQSQKIIIATTRPELLPACVAVFVNPTDSRYSHLIGKYAITPVFLGRVPILSDPLVLVEKGTGAVMCCTFGDMTDVLWWKTHKLQTRTIIAKNGCIINIDFNSYSTDPDAAQKYMQELIGLNVKKARVQIVQMLQQTGALLMSQDIVHTVKCAERSGAPLEIMIAAQWMIKSIQYKNEILATAKAIDWHPQHMFNKLETWTNGVAWDWCISRQRFFGIKFPVWYSKRKGEEGMPIFATKDQLPLDPTNSLPPGYGADEVFSDTDVMDTWATSALTTQIARNSLKYSKPTTLRCQSHEIIRTWAFGTILRSYIQNKREPWSHIMISGWCLAEDKSKMSKSKGNIINPWDMLAQYSSDDVYAPDIIRYWAANANLGSDTALSHDILQQGKKLINKIKNAAKFSTQHHIDNRFSIEESIEMKFIICACDLWIINRAQVAVAKIENYFERFNYAAALQEIETFFKSDFCDNYIEIVKTRAYNHDNEQWKMSARYTLYGLMELIIKCFAPFIPFTTHTIYKNVLLRNDSVHSIGSWIASDKLGCADVGGQIVVDILTEVRKIKSDAQISLKTPIQQMTVVLPQDRANLKNMMALDMLHDLKSVTNACEVEFIVADKDNVALEVRAVL